MIALRCLVSPPRNIVASLAAFIFITLVAPTVVFATEDFTSFGTDQNGKKIPVFQGIQSGSGESENATGIEGDGVAPSEVISFDAASVSPLSAAGRCTGWWITGNQRWKWRGITGLYVTNTISGSTSTFYGAHTRPDDCGRPALMVDRITVDLRARGLRNTSLSVRKTAYNTSTVSAEKKDRGTLASAEALCGVTGINIAFKNGVTWRTGGRSGC